MRFTNSPYEDFMKEKSYFMGVSAQPAAQRLPLRRLPLLEWIGCWCSATGNSSSPRRGRGKHEP